MASANPAAEPSGTDDLCGVVAAAQDGNRAAFGELYARFARMVHGILLARIPRSAVDDLVQDVFLTALQRISALREPAAFGAWLSVIARNRAVDFLRHAPRTIELPGDLAGVSAADAAEVTLAMAAIRSLPDAYRETLTLRLVEGMTGPEIAACTGLTEGSVRVNLHRGMKQLRERLEGRSR